MKAIFFEKHGGPEVLKYGELTDPKPEVGEALIKVRAVALNHLDIWVRRGWEGLTLDMPHIGGSDICGDLIAVNGQAAIPLGSRVVVNPGVSAQEDEWTRRGRDSLSPSYKIVGEQLKGGLAEYVCVPISNVYLAPETYSDEDAAAPLLVGTTAWRMLFRRAKLKPGETVLVVGSGGGVNSLTIILAAKMGATVYALAGDEVKAKKALSLGASAVVNYRDNPQWQIEVMKITKGRGVDLVVDNVGEVTFSKSLRSVARGGRIVTVGNTSGYNIQFDNRLLFTKQVSLLGSTMGSKQDFIDAMQFIWNRNIKVPLDKVEPLSKGVEMIQRLEEGKQFGKIVLKPG